MPRIAIPYGGDSVADFVCLLARLTALDRLRNRRGRSQAFLKLADVVGQSRKRVNSALEHPQAVAFTFEFARRLAAAPPGTAEARRYLEWFLWKVLQMAEPLEQWSALPSERIMRERTERANGRPGSLLTAEESLAWRELCEHESVWRFAERGRCETALELVCTPDCVRAHESAMG